MLVTIAVVLVLVGVGVSQGVTFSASTDQDVVRTEPEGKLNVLIIWVVSKGASICYCKICVCIRML